METTTIVNDNTLKATLPEFITFEGKQIPLTSLPELASYQNTLRAQIQQQEKNKLYTTINELQKKVAELMAKPETPAVVPVDALAESLKAFGEKLTNELTTKFEAQIAEKLSPVTQQSEFLRQQNLETYRAKLLTENQGTCIPDLVKGNTTEELDASLVESKRIFGETAKYFQAPAVPSATATPAQTNSPAPAQSAQTAQNNVATPNVQVPSQTAQPPVPPTPTAPVTNEPADPFKSLANMSLSEWGKQRESIKERLKELVPQN